MIILSLVYLLRVSIIFFLLARVSMVPFTEYLLNVRREKKSGSKQVFSMQEVNSSSHSFSRLTSLCLPFLQLPRQLGKVVGSGFDRGEVNKYYVNKEKGRIMDQQK